MSTKKNDLSERAARLSQKRRESAQANTGVAGAAGAAPATTTVAVRTKPVRLTVDLAPLVHRELNGFCRQVADQRELTRVPAAEVVRALIAELQQDLALQERVAERLAAKA